MQDDANELLIDTMYHKVEAGPSFEKNKRIPFVTAVSNYNPTRQ